MQQQRGHGAALLASLKTNNQIFVVCIYCAAFQLRPKTVTEKRVPSSTHQGLKERLMKRKVVSLLIISLPVLLAVIMLQQPVTGQSTPAETNGNALPQPQQLVIRQQIPLSFTITAPAQVSSSVPSTTTGNLLDALVSSIARSANMTPTATMQTVVVTLTLDLQLTVTDTLTTTVPSTVTLTLADESITAPVTVTVGPAPQAAVAITLLPPLAAEAALTATEEITPVATVSVTTETAGAAVTATTALTGTIAITANLRAGPDTTFEAVSTVPAGQRVTVVAQNADATWYLLNNSLWIASSLVSDIQGQPPIATEELVTALRAQIVLTPTTPVTVTTPVTATTPTTPTATAITTATTTVTTTATTTATTTSTGPSLILVPTPTTVTQSAQPSQPPRVTVDANLRAGPGITFTLLGGTITGQEINIVARNDDGSWFLLDNGGWVSAALVANPPIDVPLYTAEPPAENAPAATATPLPTPTPAPTSTTPVLGVRENLYVIRVDGIVDGYDFTLTKIDDLINQANGDVALLKDRAWIVEMTTAITLLRSTGDEASALTAPPLFADAHAILLEAATAFASAADLLAEGVDQLDTDRLDQAFVQITTGSALLTRAQDAVEEATP